MRPTLSPPSVDGGAEAPGVTATAQLGGSLISGPPGNHLFQGPGKASRSKATGWGEGAGAPREAGREGSPGALVASPTRAWPPRGRCSHLQLREGRPGHPGAVQPRAAPVTARQASLCEIPVRTSLVAERTGVGPGAGDTGSIPGPGRFHGRQKYRACAGRRVTSEQGGASHESSPAQRLERRVLSNADPAQPIIFTKDPG